MGSLSMSETKLAARLTERENLDTPHACTAIPVIPEAGADLALIEAHETELESIVQQMWKDMTTETKLLDGTEVPERETIEILPRITEEEFRVLLKTDVEPTEEEDHKE